MATADDNNTLTGLPIASQNFANHILGPPVAGWMGQIFFMGMLTRQAMDYVRSPSYKRDSTYTKAFLWTTLALTYGQLGIGAYSIWHYATWQIRDSDTMYAQTKADCLTTFFVGFEAAVVQYYLSRRAALLIRNNVRRWIYTIVIFIGIIGALTGAILYMVISFVVRGTQNQSIGGLTFNVATGMWLWCAVFVDVVITISLTVALRSRMRGFNSETDSLIKRIIWLNAQNASYTALFAVVGAIFSLAFSSESLNANISAAIWLCLSPFYAISLLTTLAGRAKLAQPASHKVGPETTVTTGPAPANAIHRGAAVRRLTPRPATTNQVYSADQSPISSSSPRLPIQIHMTRQVDVDYDEEKVGVPGDEDDDALHEFAHFSSKASSGPPLIT